MQIFHDEYRTRNVGDVFAEFIGGPGFRLKHSEVRLHEVYIDHTLIFLKSHTTMGTGAVTTQQHKWQAEQADAVLNKFTSSHSLVSGKNLQRIQTNAAALGLDQINTSLILLPGDDGAVVIEETAGTGLIKIVDHAQHTRDAGICIDKGTGTTHVGLHPARMQ